MPKVHYIKASGPWAACGFRAVWGSLVHLDYEFYTRTPEEVTCGSCKRSKAFKLVSLTTERKEEVKRDEDPQKTRIANVAEIL